MTATPERVRFAPSPTGYLHVGGARTALFNWLWARKTGGKFILRIEDTDLQRSTRESVDAIFQSMRWLGLDWDEGPQDADDMGGGAHAPYFQTRRLELYKTFAAKLIRSGHAYRCYATREDIEAERNKLPEKQRDRFRFVSPWRDKTEELDRPYVVRFKTPADGEVRWQDIVFGEMSTPNSEQTDFILLRTDGVPLYNFGAVVDDLTMGITLVARGKDHLINTPPQIMVYRALGEALPRFAHLPMMLANKKEKLSKRHGSVSVSEYSTAGYLPDALLSYLIRFGWSHGDDEVFTRAKMIELFDWNNVGRSDGIYDFRKCLSINQKYINQVATEHELLSSAAPRLAARGIAVTVDDPILKAAVPTVRARAETLDALSRAMEFYFREPEMDPAAVTKFLVPEHATALDGLADLLTSAPVFERDPLHHLVEGWLAQNNRDMKTVGQPVRVALTGRAASPGMFEMMEILGRDKTVSRLRSAAARSRGATA